MKELNGFMAVFTSHESDVHERWVQGDNHACYGPGGGSMQELKPCPHCGSIDVYVRGRINAQVTCRICGMEGPEPWGNKAAIAAWNNLPRMSTIIAWQFQAAGAALALQRLISAAQHMREAQQAYDQYGSNEDSMSEAEEVFDGLLADLRNAMEARNG